MLQPAITAESLSSRTKILVFSEKIANLNRFFEVLIWPLISDLLWDESSIFAKNKRKKIDMKRITENLREYHAPEMRVVSVSVESSVCAGSNVKIVETDKPSVEVDDWDAIGNDVSFD